MGLLNNVMGLKNEDLRKWVQEKWVDIGAPKKGGGYKPCGRSKGEKRKGYPKCVPLAKANAMSKGQKRSAVKRKRAAGNAGPKPTNVSTFSKKSKMKKENLGPTGTALYEKLCARGKAAAKRKFKVYPSAYANMYASSVCSGKTTPGGKKKKKNESYERLQAHLTEKKGTMPKMKMGVHKSRSGGLTAKGVAAYRRKNPGSKLKTAVTTKPSKLKKGSKAASRRKSFCSRMGGMKKRLTSKKTANDPNSRINKALRKWNC
jgi:hypothetical protein